MTASVAAGIIGILILGAGIVVTNLVYRYNPTAVTSPTRRRVGVNSDASPTALAAMKKLGITQVRTSINWHNDLDPRTFNDAGDLDPAGITPRQRANNIITDLRAAGLDVLVVVHTPPTGMSFADGIVAMPPFVAARAAQFPGLAWEVLNEANSQDAFAAGWFSATDPSITQETRGDLYGQLLGPVYDAVKAADPTALVVTGGADTAVHDFLLGILGRAPTKFDAFCVHCFNDPNAFILNGGSRIADIIGGHPVWTTEFGNSDPDASTQALNVGQMLDDNDRNSRYARAYLYDLISTDG
jgi:hypothetical protein